MLKQLILCLIVLCLFTQSADAADVTVRYWFADHELVIGEISLRGQVVIRIRSGAGGQTIPERTAVIADRLLRIHLNGDSQIQPVRMNDGYVVVTVDGQPMATVDETTAEFSRVSAWELACAWSNNLRRVVGIEQRQWADPSAVTWWGAGIASWYGPGFIGRFTASGELFCGTMLTAAHRSLPMGTIVRVVRVDTGDSVIVRINDRGPFIRGRVIDLSRRAAEVIGLVSAGLVEVELWILQL